jgi:hypothetical protein
MVTAAQNLEFERAAQLRDKVKEMKGMPDITSAGGLADAEPSDQRAGIWVPRSKNKGKRGAKRQPAK